MIVPVMAISNLVLTQQIYSEETNGAHAHYREPVPLMQQTLNPFTDIKILFRISLYFATFRGFPQFHKFVIGKSSQFSTVQ